MSEAGPEGDGRLSPVRVRLRSRDDPAGMWPGDALSRYRRFMVVGAAGAGKTTMLRQLAAGSAPDALSLRGYADSGVPDIVLYAVTGPDGVDSATAERITTGEAPLLLDGLDEVLGGATHEEARAAYRRVVDALDRLCADHPQARVVVTCRPGAQHGVADTWPVLEIADLSETQAEAIVRERLPTEPWRARMVLAAAATDPVLGAFAANPLVLSLLSAAPEADLQSAAGRAGLFAGVVQHLLVGRDARRGVERFSHLTAAGTHELLAELAWHVHCRNRNEFDCGEAVLPEGEDPGRAREVLDQIVAGSGLLTTDDGDVYRFAYPGVQVYFAAVAATARGATAVAHLVRHRHDPWWQEVLLLVADRTEDASPLLRGILGLGGRRPVRRLVRHLSRLDDDLEHRDLLLAARYLGVGRRIRPRSLATAVIKATYALMRAGPSYDIRAAAAQALSSIGDRRLRDRLVADLTDSSLNRLTRGQLAGDLGRTGDDGIAARLTATLETLDQYDSIDEDLAIALRIHRYTPAVPVIRARLDHRQRAGSSGHFLAGALAALGGADEAEHLWRRLQEYAEARNSGIPESILRALGHAADSRVEPWLLDAVRAGPHDHLSAAVDGYLARRGHGGVPHLVTALLARPSWGAGLADIARTLQFYAASAPAGPVFDAFIDTRRNQSVRWAMSALLDAHPDTWPALRALLDRPGTGRLAVAASAAVLGRQEHPPARDPLRRALPALVRQRGLAVRPFALRRVAEALSVLGDDEWAQEALLSYIRAHLGPSPPRAGIRPLLTALGATRLDLIADEVSDLVVRLAVDAPTDIDHWFWADGAALAELPTVAARLLDLVESGRLDQDQTLHALHALERAAPDPSLAPRVLPLLSAGESPQDARMRARMHPSLPFAPKPYAALQVLTAIGRHHHVRIFADGRIVPLRP